MQLPEDGMHNKKLGRKGEKAAARYLKRKGYKILGRNVRTPFCEIDIIARRGEVVAFVEVKTRVNDNFGLPEEAVTPQKQRLYFRAARLYEGKHGDDDIIRFDIIEVFKGKINHIENAFYPDGGF